jgi:hypothetical protein
VKELSLTINKICEEYFNGIPEKGRIDGRKRKKKEMGKRKQTENLHCSVTA